MDANKVASLMRRRENLKPITGLQPVVGSSMENRILPTVKIAATRTLTTEFKPVPVALHAPRIVHSSSECIRPKAHGAAGTYAARPMASAGLRLRPRNVVVDVAPRRVNSTPRILQAQLAMLRNGAAPQESTRRTFEMLRPAAPKMVLTHFVRRRSGAILTPFNQSCRVRPLLSGPIAGMDLRVSKSQGFRPPRLRTRTTVISPRTKSDLDFTDVPFKLEMAQECPVPEPTFAAVPLVIREPRLPGARKLAPRSASPWPATSLLKSGAPSRTVPAEPRVLSAVWNVSPSEASLRCEWYITTPHITLGYSEEPRKAQSAAEAARTPVPAVSRMEENFDSGCSNWVGGVADWRLDAAGARTGSLALYVPSLELQDYEMEFLVRLENRSATWVFRAADTNDYYRAALRITPEGSYEFTRSAVIGGTAEPGVSAPVAVNNNARTALSVRTCVKGSEFEVFVDGLAVDHWTDERLPVGGVGFGGAPDDRARLYWLRLTYTDSPGHKDVTR